MGQLGRKMSAETVSYKVFLKDKENAEEVRRFVVDKDVSTSFTYLQEKLYTVFPQLKQKIFSVSWTDEDGDNVTIGMDEELIIALTEMPGPVYKLKVVVKNVEKSMNSGNYQKETAEAKNLIHHGVTCDSCEKTPIEGYRYKCVVCDDFDLCGICEAAGCHPGHNAMRIANPEMVFPQRLFKRIHKMQERAEKSRSRHEKDKVGSSGLPAGGHVPPPPFGFPGRGRGFFRGRGFGGMRGMGPLPGCSGVGAWAGPAFDAMMRGWMGDQSGNPQPESSSQEANLHSAEHQQAHETAFEAAQEAHEQAHHAASAAAAAAAAAATASQDAHQAAFEQFATTMNGNAEYLKNVGTFVAAALDPLGIDVQVDIETPEGQRRTVQTASSSSSSSSTSRSSSVATDQKTKETSTEGTENIEEPTSAKTGSDDEEWTVVEEKKEESAKEIPIQIPKDEEVGKIYPSLPDNQSTSSGSTSTASVATNASGSTVTSHANPKIQVALQAMMNMGFSNEGGWLTSLLEAKDGDIGKVLDILQPVKK